MQTEKSLTLPPYDAFVDSIAVLSLPFSASEMHGMMCAYLTAGAIQQGETYLQALINQQKDEPTRTATMAIFTVYSISQQQISNMDFEFQMLLPFEEEDLKERAKAFSEWCDGFIQGLSMHGIRAEQLNEDETQSAFQHITDFSELDYDSLEVGEEDEKALMEITEFTRMAVLSLHAELMANNKNKQETMVAH